MTEGIRERLSEVQTSILEFGHRDAMPLELLVEGASWYSEPFGGPLNATFFFLQDAFDVLSFEFEQREARVLVESLRSRASVKVKIFQAYGFMLAKQDSTLDHIAEFS